MAVQRYNMGSCCGDEYTCRMVPNDSGDYVDYTNYERLEEENAELRQTINRLEENKE